jgi:hypothetical protein
MAFDAKEYMASLEPPTLVAMDGTTHVGRFVSMDQWMTLWPRLKSALERRLDYTGTKRLMDDLAATFFPPEPDTRGWFARLWKPAPAPSGGFLAFQALPLQAQMDAMRDFMRAQAKALGMESQTPGPA